MALDRLLILGCSQKKRPDSGLLPALDRYDGPMFRVLRKCLRECPGGAQGLETYILSAEFGLMQASTRSVLFLAVIDSCRYLY